MNELHFPWIELAILVPLLGAVWVARRTHPVQARIHCLVVAGLAFVATLAESQDFYSLHSYQAEDKWHLMTRLFGHEFFILDELSAPLLPLTALLYLLMALATPRAKMPRFSFSSMLITEALTLALFSTKEPWLVIGLLALSTIPPGLEILARGRPVRMYAIAMTTSMVLIALGWSFTDAEETRTHSWWALLPMLIGVSIRCGVFPFHVWLRDLFHQATFGTALLVATPMAGAYAALRLVVPVAPDWVLSLLGLMSLFTAVHSAGMALVQRDARSFFSCMVVSHSAMVLVGLEVVSEIGLTGALCVWLSAGLSLCGLGLTLRALEARQGRLQLSTYQGLYEHTPVLAVCFLLTGLGCVGFPGTMGFVGTELLIDGAVEAYPHVGPLLVIATAFNGIAIVRTYFLLFTGTRYVSSVPLPVSGRERIAVLTLTALILGGGLFPQPSVATRFHAARELLRERADGQTDATMTPPPHIELPCPLP